MGNIRKPHLNWLQFLLLRLLSHVVLITGLPGVSGTGRPETPKTGGISQGFRILLRVVVSTCVCSIFHQKNGFRLLESARRESLPGKDAVYRFPNHSGYAWQRFLSALSSDTVQRVAKLTSNQRRVHCG